MICTVVHKLGVVHTQVQVVQGLKTTDGYMAEFHFLDGTAISSIRLW
jgi:hypothetical protein